MFIGRLEVTIFLLTIMRSIRLMLTRRNNYLAHLSREKKFLTARDRKAYREKMKAKKLDERNTRLEDRKKAEMEANEALLAFDKEQESNQNSIDP